MQVEGTYLNYVKCLQRAFLLRHATNIHNYNQPINLAHQNAYG